MKKITLIGLSLILSCVVHPQSCEKQDIKLQVLGSGGPELNDGRVSSSHLLWVNGKATVLIDAGSGSAHQFEKVKGNSEDIKAILLTHLHIDHSADLPAYIKDSYFTERKNDLWVMGPKGNNRMPDTSVYLDKLFGEYGVFAYMKRYWLPKARSSYKIKAIDADLDHAVVQRHPLTDEISISSIGVHHGPISAVGWRVDMGDCAITFSGDMTNKYDSLTKLARGSDLLVANYTIGESATKRAKNMHMPPSIIGKIANQAKVSKLLLAHLMNSSIPYLDDTKTLIEKIYQGPVLVAEDLMIIDLE